MSAFFSSRRGRRLSRILRLVFTTGIVAFLAVQLTRIGWADVLGSLPSTPWFYVLWLMIYSTLPLSEVLIYGRLWNASVLGLLFASLRKRVLNSDVMGYSGEVYLYVWARGRLTDSGKRIWQVIKDNLIVSSLASVGTAVLILAVLLLAGLVNLDPWVDESTWWYVGAGAVVTILATTLLVQFRRVVFSFPASVIGWMAAIHTGRFLVAYSLQVILWWSVVPEAPFRAWAVLLAILILTYRIPFLPSRDLLFVGVSVELHAVIGVGQAALAGMLLAQSVLEKAVNAVLFLTTSLWDRRRGRKGPLPEDVEPPREEPAELEE